MKLSVIIPVYNMEKYLENSINSILSNINTKDYECILIDGGSSDSSLNICCRFQKQYSNITYIRLEKFDENEIKNIGLNFASGEYIYFINGCDLLCENFISTAIEFLEKNVDYCAYIRNGCERRDDKNFFINYYFNEYEIGPELSMCVFRKSFINTKFQNILCTDSIFTGKIIQNNKYFFENTSYNSYIKIVEDPFPRTIDYATEFNLDVIRYIKEEIQENNN